MWYCWQAGWSLSTSDLDILSWPMTVPLGTLGTPRYHTRWQSTSCPARVTHGRFIVDLDLNIVVCVAGVRVSDRYMYIPMEYNVPWYMYKIILMIISSFQYSSLHCCWMSFHEHDLLLLWGSFTVYDNHVLNSTLINVTQGYHTIPCLWNVNLLLGLPQLEWFSACFNDTQK